MKKHFFLSLMLLFSIAFLQAKSIYYVKEQSAGEGTSWSDSGDLQAMIRKAVAGDQIWVAAGTYQPVSPVYFELKEGVEIYGGFSGNETELQSRDWKANITTLKAAGANNLVVRNYMNNLTTASVLDGFTITGASRPTSDGGGIYNNTSSPTYRNCTVTGNVGSYGAGVFNKQSNAVFINVSITGNSGNNSGAGMYNDNSSVKLTNVIIQNNIAGEFGGGMRNHQSSYPTLINVLIANNQAVKGGGICNSTGSNPIITNATITGNIATSLTDGGGGIYNLNSSPLVNNTIIWGNKANGSISVLQEGFAGESNTTQGDSMPVGDLNGWQQILAEDFLINSTSETFGSVYSNSWTSYDDGGKYYKSTISAHDGVMDFTLDGIKGAAGWYGPRNTLYGKYSMRLKAVNASDNGTAIMLWPTGNNWGYGEIDYPEGNFQGNMGLFHHGINCTNCSASDSYNTGVTWVDWHIVSIEWTSTSVKYYLDNALIKTVTHDIPINDHRYTLQVAPNGPSPQPGHFLIDWVTIYSLCPTCRVQTDLQALYSNCLIEGTAVEDGIISNSDPLFINPESGDYNLQRSSPARNAGDNKFINEVLTDLSGDLRIVNNVVDLGAYESNYESAALDNFKENSLKIYLYPNPVKENLYIQTDIYIKNVSIFDVAGCNILQTVPANNSVNVAGLKRGIYFIKIETSKGYVNLKINKI